MEELSLHSVRPFSDGHTTFPFDFRVSSLFSRSWVVFLNLYLSSLCIHAT